MSRVVVGDDLGRIQLNGVVLPGLYQQATIDAEMELDTKKRPNKSGTSKVSRGFNDATIKLRVHLIYDDNGGEPLAQIQTISKLFYGLDRKGRAVTHRIVNPTINAFGIKRVLFDRVKIADTNRTDVVAVDIHLTQYRPIPRVRKRMRRAKLPTLNGLEAATKAAEDAFQAKLDALGQHTGQTRLLPELGSPFGGGRSGGGGAGRSWGNPVENESQRLIRELNELPATGLDSGATYPKQTTPNPAPLAPAPSGIAPADPPATPFVDDDKVPAP
jgi:hypothetical protein